jgi:hypothetical protein
MSEAQIASILPGSYQALRSLETDSQQPFSSAPEMGDRLTSLNVSLLYNSFQVTAAPPAGRPFALQNTTQGYPSEANAASAYASLRQRWQSPGLFESTTQQGDLGSTWAGSFCQLGTFASGNQRSEWYVCMAQTGPYVATISVGGFTLELGMVAPAVQAYFDAANRVFQG